MGIFDGFDWGAFFILLVLIGGFTAIHLAYLMEWLDVNWYGKQKER